METYITTTNYLNLDRKFYVLKKMVRPAETDVKQTGRDNNILTIQAFYLSDNVGLSEIDSI